MISLNNYIQEKLIVNKNYKPYKYHPKTWDELRKIIIDRFKELGPGTEQEPINFNDIDVSKLETFVSDNRRGAFEETKVEYIDVSDWDVSNVTDMFAMFANCNNLISTGDLSNWNISNVEDTEAMFFACEKLESIGDLSNWNISNIKYMASMFDECKQLKSVGDLSKWDVSCVHNMNYMFANSGIINIPKWYEE